MGGWRGGIAGAGLDVQLTGGRVRLMLATARAVMNAKILLKSLFVVLVLLLLVLMGMNNRGVVDFALPPLIPRRIQQPAALMYFAFFAIGFLTGTIVWAGLGKGKKGGSNRSSGGK